MQISSSDVVPGLVIKAAVENAQGQMLLPSGTVLVAKHVRLLKSWAIEAIDVEDTVVPTATAASNTSEAVAALDARFALVHGDPVLDRLRDLVARRLESGGRP